MYILDLMLCINMKQDCLGSIPRPDRGLKDDVGMLHIDTKSKTIDVLG
jgi:hypothetical protein